MIRDGLTLCPVLLLNWVTVRREIILGSETKQEVVRPNGLEPSTPTMSRWCSNQLSYGRTVLLSGIWCV